DMSSILLSNPYLPPTFHGGTAPDPTPALALAPVTTAGTAGTGDKAADFANSGNSGGEKGDGDIVTLMQLGKSAALTRPQDATGQSVVDAQGQDRGPVVTMGANLPEVPMPNPLPTSPFLKQSPGKGPQG
ncbi:MAG: hypothetical protein P1U53_03730, partial [Sulfitobacter sp.]|nr:hypothetical protein [Sulfitobacter sp.]